MRIPLVLLLLAAPLLAQGDLPRDIAAAHPSWQDGGWTIRKADLYRHLVRYLAGHPTARLVLPDYLRRRLIEDAARKAKITVTDRDVQRWIDALDARIKQQSGGTMSLESYRKRYNMTMAELKRRGRLGVLRERVARSIVLARDKTRDPEKELEESNVVLIIDEMYTGAKKVFENLEEGIVAKINDIEVTDYQYGRELSFALPTTEVARALEDLIMAEEAKLLIGNDNPPTAEEQAAERKWFIEFEMNRLRRLAQAQAQGRPVPKITRKMIEDVLKRRGLTLELALGNPASQAQARARGYFRRMHDASAWPEGSPERAQAEARLRKYYEANKGQYGDELKVQRIFIRARAQQVGNVGQKMRTLPQGRAVAAAVHARAVGGEEFDRLARENSDDVDVIRKNGGLVPLWLTANTPGYEDTWKHANGLEKEGQISKPFFSRQGGYIIVKLLERKKALGFAGQRERILAHATELAYRNWRAKAVRRALKSKSVLERDK